jgi:hypothetical protein
MRNDPLFMCWLVRCGSEEDARRLQAAAAGLTADTIVRDLVRAFPGGWEARWVEPYRLGDYFAEVRALPAPSGSPFSFRILFHRRPDAGRFWKDLMVRILQAMRGAAPDVSTTLDYRGDTEVA